MCCNGIVWIQPVRIVQRLLGQFAFSGGDIGSCQQQEALGIGRVGRRACKQVVLCGGNVAPLKVPAAPREQSHIERRIQGESPADQRLGFVRPVLIQVKEGKIDIGDGVHRLQGNGAPQRRLGLAVRAQRGLHRPDLVPQRRHARGFGNRAVQHRQGIGMAAFEIRKKDRLRLQRAWVVGVDGKRPCNRGPRLVAVVDQHRQLRPCSRKDRLVREARLGHGEFTKRGRDVQQDRLGIGMGQRA